MNNFNNQFNNMNRKQIPMGSLMGQRTNSAYKFLISLAIGILPLLLCSLFITDPEMAGEFNQWGNGGPQNAILEVQYGFMWLIGLIVYISIFPIILAITKLTKEVKLDVIPSAAASGLAMLNMFVIPHSSRWFLLLSIPSFAIIGYIIGMFVMVLIVVNSINKQMDQLQNDPNFKQMMDQVQRMQGQNPNMMNMPNNKNNKPANNKKDIKNNPFVDVDIEEDNEDNDKN